MNWSEHIPLLTLLAVVFSLGVGSAQLRALYSAVGDLRGDLKESAKAQGTRIGAVEDRAAILEDFKARIEGRAEAQREMSGVVRG